MIVCSTGIQRLINGVYEINSGNGMLTEREMEALDQWLESATENLLRRLALETRSRTSLVGM